MQMTSFKIATRRQIENRILLFLYDTKLFKIEYAHIRLQYKSWIGTYKYSIIESFLNFRGGIIKYILIYYKRGIKRYTNQNRSKNKPMREHNIKLYILYDSTVF